MTKTRTMRENENVLHYHLMKRMKLKLFIRNRKNRSCATNQNINKSKTKTQGYCALKHTSKNCWFCYLSFYWKFLSQVYCRTLVKINIKNVKMLMKQLFDIL